MTQQFFPNTEPPDQNPAVQEAIDEWREARRECRRMREVRDVKHAALLALLQEHKLETFSFIDELTGKKRRVRHVTTTKVKDEKAPRERDVEDDEVDFATPDGEISKVRDADGKIESRRVPRSTVADEIGEHDGFAATRASMETH